jgi:hypothetical protein
VFAAWNRRTFTGLNAIHPHSTARFNRWYRFWADDAGLKRWSLVVGRKLKERFACSRDATGVVYTDVGLKELTFGPPQPPTIQKAKV